MKCPVCQHADSKVTDTRLVDDGFSIRRRRECPKCGFRFSTFEEVEILNLTVLKRDGTREGYRRDKLEGGLRKALEKRPVTREEFKRLISQIERDIQKQSTAEVKTQAIGEIVMRHLKRFDPVGYIRFASVYRSFKDAETFKRELNSLLQSRKPTPLNRRSTRR